MKKKKVSLWLELVVQSYQEELFSVSLKNSNLILPSGIDP